MKYSDFLKREQFSKEELIAFSWQRLVDDPPASGCGILPSPPLLMFDRITKIRHDGSRGLICAEQDISFDQWFFQCHFRNDPVQAGCLGVDAIWQMLGFYCCVRGAKGSGRALGTKEIEFAGQIRPYNKLVSYEASIRRFSHMEGKGVAICIGDARVLVDGVEIYTIQGAKVGVFQNIAYDDYPNSESLQARGGIIEKNGGRA